MNESNTRKLKALNAIKELEVILYETYNISIPELKKLENIIAHDSVNSNAEKIFSFAYRRIQEIGIYDDVVDNLFKDIYQLISK